MLDNHWDADKEAVEHAFLSRLIIKKKDTKEPCVEMEPQLLDIVHCFPCPKVPFLVYYITSRLTAKDFLYVRTGSTSVSHFLFLQAGVGAFGPAPGRWQMASAV